MEYNDKKPSNIYIKHTANRFTNGRPKIVSNYIVRRRSSDGVHAGGAARVVDRSVRVPSRTGADGDRRALLVVAVRLVAVRRRGRVRRRSRQLRRLVDRLHRPAAPSSRSRRQVARQKRRRRRQ